MWWGSLQRGQLNKSPCRCKKKHFTKSEGEKKLTNSIKLDLPKCPLLPLIFIQRYTRSINFSTFRKKLSNSSIYLWTNFLAVHWRCLQNIALQNPKKIPISLNYVLASFPFTPYIFIKGYTWSINFENINWKLSIFWTYFEIR